MQQRSLGPFSVSAIGMGCMNISFGYGDCSDEQAGELLNTSLDAGYTFLDTAELYGAGRSESLIAKYLGGRRNEYTLATKCGLTANGMDGRPEVITKSCEGSLKRLKTDVIDLYYLHRADPKVPIEETVGALGRLVEAGKVRTIGLSEVSTENLRKAAAEFKITALQSEYSLWSRTPERGILDACRELDVVMVPFSPLGRQFLTGKSPDVSQLPDSDLRCTIARPRFEPDAFEKNMQLMMRYGEIADEVGCTKAQLGLAWLLAKQSGAMIPIPGTRNPEHAVENAGAADVQLSPAVVDELDALINEKTVVGTRYTSERMASSDSERD